MHKVELLSPAGDFKSLYYAIHNGADAVYLGGKRFGARSYAANFDDEEMVKAIKYAHLYGVKIYVTVNTIIFDDEIDDVIKYIGFLHENNVDAVIMQDLGAIKRVRETYPNLEVHASTQMHNHNSYGIKLLESLGLKRVVMAREMSINEIKEINTTMEKEVFVYGAICVCYSGCCLFSSMNTNRSGNRGECIASCRLPYKLLDDNGNLVQDSKYLLSPKELNTINYVDKLINSGIDSFKIEGRMKSPEYVGLVTRLYRNAIDNYYNKKSFSLDSSDEKALLSLFNRKFTKGYLFGDYGKDLMNISSPNHQGVHLGNIISTNNKYIKVRLDDDVNQEDGIRFVDENKGMILNRLYNEKGLLVNKVSKGNIALFDNKIGLKSKGAVNKTIDRELISKLSNVTELKIKVDLSIEVLENQPLSLKITDGVNSVTVSKDIVDKAINRPTTKEEIIKQISRMGDTPFSINKIDAKVDENIFVPIKGLNELRRDATEKLIELRENKIVKVDNPPFNIKSKKVEKESFGINVLVRNEDQLKASLELHVNNIYVTDYKLYKKYKASNVYYSMPRVVSNYTELNGENLLIRELGSIKKYKDSNNIISDYTLNVVNADSISLLNDLGVNRICFSPEVKIGNISSRVSKYNTELIVYGRMELMISKYCMLNMLLNNDNKKCFICKNNNYYLKDEKNKIYPIRHEGHLMVIYDSKSIDLINKIPSLKDRINNFRINLFDEDYNEAKELIERVIKSYE